MMETTREKPIKCELYRDNFQNYKRYSIPKAQLVIADIPYRIGVDAFASNFCSFEQIPKVIEYGKMYGFNNNYPLFFIKNYSAQVLKANMKIVGATEHAVVLYRDKLPKFRNGGEVGEDGRIIKGTGGRMIYNWFNWERDSSKDYPKIHPTQKPIKLLKELISIFTDEGDVVIDPVAGSATTLRAAYELGRSSYGFEVEKKFYDDAINKMLKNKGVQLNV